MGGVTNHLLRPLGQSEDGVEAMTPLPPPAAEHPSLPGLPSPHPPRPHRRGPFAKEQLLASEG